MSHRFAFFPHALLWDADSNQLFTNGKLLADASRIPLLLTRPPRGLIRWNEERLEVWLREGYEAVMLSLQSVLVLVFENHNVYYTVDLDALKEKNIPFFEEIVRMKVRKKDRA